MALVIDLAVAEGEAEADTTGVRDIKLDLILISFCAVDENNNY